MSEESIERANCCRNCEHAETVSPHTEDCVKYQMLLSHAMTCDLFKMKPATITKEVQ